MHYLEMHCFGGPALLRIALKIVWNYMNLQIGKCVLFLVAIAVAACSTTFSNRGNTPTITKSAQSDEVRKATLVGVTFPADCRSLAKAFPPGKTTFNVSYQEPDSNQNGKPA